VIETTVEEELGGATGTGTPSHLDHTAEDKSDGVHLCSWQRTG
jgi:hypothetical protein